MTSFDVTSSELTLGILGCGSLGTAILNGLLDGLSSTDGKDTVLPRRFIVTVRSNASVSNLRKSLSGKESVQILQGDNVKVVKESDIVILSCPPDVVPTVLKEEGIRDALEGKLLVSLAAGVTRSRIESFIYGSATTAENAAERCWVMRAMPNTAASIGKSMTGIEISEPVPPESTIRLVDTIFEQVGSIIHLPASQMDACSALCGSTPAFIALFCDALIDGAVVSGVPRDKAQIMAAQTLVGTAALLQNCERPSSLREDVCASPGCTITGVMTLEQGGVRGTISKAMQDAISKASQLG